MYYFLKLYPLCRDIPQVIKLLYYLCQLLYLGIMFSKQLLGISTSDHLQNQLKTIYKDIKIYIACKMQVWLCFDGHKWYTSTGYAFAPLILYIYIFNKCVQNEKLLTVFIKSLLQERKEELK